MLSEMKSGPGPNTCASRETAGGEPENPEGWYVSEIGEQPEALRRLLHRGWNTAEDVAERVRAFEPGFAVIAARGTSDNAARYAQYLLGIRNGLCVALAAPSIVTRYEATPRLSRSLVIGISQSGRSPDVVAVIREARRQEALTVAVVNDPSSPLAQEAELCLPIHAGRERAVAATKTYMGQLTALAMLSTAVARDGERRRELDALPEHVAACLSMHEGIHTAAHDYKDTSRFVVLGRGYNRCTAFETALKIKETSYAMAEPYSGADFLHGPVAMLDHQLPVIAIAPGVLWRDETRCLIERARDQRAPVIAVSDRPDVLDAAQVPLPLPPSVPEWLSPMVAIVPGQLWSAALAAHRGAKPDAPRGLQKVTETW